MAAFAYLLRCADGSFYGGWTTDPMRRVAAHNAGTGARYTRARRPVELVYLERCCGKSEALRREAALKALSHGEKQRLAERPDALAALEERPCEAGGEEPPRESSG